MKTTISNMLSNDKILNIVRKNRHLYYRTLKAYHKDTYNYIDKSYSGQNISEKIYKHIYGERFCLKCNKLLGGRGFKGLHKGYSTFCSDNCAEKHSYRLNKIKNSNIKLYGVKWIGESKVVIEKIRKNNIKKYGVPHVLQVKEILEKKNNTCRERYGYTSPNQNPEIFKKQEKYKYKTYQFPSGKKIKVQGYEPFALNQLLLTYPEEYIITSKSKMPPFWYYTNDNKKHRYYPDIFIKPVNAIIEVKSIWTNKIDKNLELKKSSVINSGYNFKKLIFNQKGELINE